MNFKREYYYKHDFYNMNSDDQLTILPKFKTRQGIVDCACGPNCILMIMNYFNDYSLEEDTICKVVQMEQRFKRSLIYLENIIMKLKLVLKRQKMLQQEKYFL